MIRRGACAILDLDGGVSMNNEEKILSMLADLKSEMGTMKSEMNARFDKIEEDTEILKEDTAITREAANTLLDWAHVVDHMTLNQVIQQRAAKAE